MLSVQNYLSYYFDLGQPQKNHNWKSKGKREYEYKFL